jgi:hypothetical protein
VSEQPDLATETRPTGPWHRDPYLSSRAGDPPHRRHDESRASLDVIYADRGKTVPVAVNDYDGCYAVILSTAIRAEANLVDHVHYASGATCETCGLPWLTTDPAALTPPATGAASDPLREALNTSPYEWLVEYSGEKGWYEAMNLVRAALAASPTTGSPDREASDTALALLDQPILRVTEDGDHDHTGVPCRTCVLLGAEDWSVDRIASALPYDDFDREQGESFTGWQRRFAARIVSRLARVPAGSPDRLTEALDVERLARVRGEREFGAYYPERDLAWARDIAAEYLSQSPSVAPTPLEDPE